MEIYSKSLSYYSCSSSRPTSVSNISLFLEKIKSEISLPETYEIFRFIDSLLQLKYPLHRTEKADSDYYSEEMFKHYVDFSLHYNKKLIGLVKRIFSRRRFDMEDNVILHILFGIGCWAFKSDINLLYNNIFPKIYVEEYSFHISTSFDDISDALRLYLGSFYA